MEHDNMHNRATDTTDVTVGVKREIPLTWVLSGFVVFMLASGGWAIAITNAQRDTGRDVAQIKDDIKDIKSSGARTLDEITKGVIRNVEVAGRLSDMERRINNLEAKQGGK